MLISTQKLRNIFSNITSFVLDGKRVHSVISRLLSCFTTTDCFHSKFEWWSPLPTPKMSFIEWSRCRRYLLFLLPITDDYHQRQYPLSRDPWWQREISECRTVIIAESHVDIQCFPLLWPHWIAKPICEAQMCTEIFFASWNYHAQKIHDTCMAQLAFSSAAQAGVSRCCRWSHLRTHCPC